VPQPFPQLSVFENVLASATFGAGMKGQEADRAAARVLELTGLWQSRQQAAGSLPLLSRKRLELAKALAVRPKVLLLDEIAGGLTEPEVHELVKLILSLKKDFAIMWIEHVAHALVAVADSIMVLHFGKKLAEGDPKEVMSSSEVREIYMGVTADAAAPG
jgi:branched-chain amino acid transport system ATP-binding protein